MAISYYGCHLQSAASPIFDASGVISSFLGGFLAAVVVLLATNLYLAHWDRRYRGLLFSEVLSMNWGMASSVYILSQLAGGSDQSEIENRLQHILGDGGDRAETGIRMVEPSVSMIDAALQVEGWGQRETIIEGIGGDDLSSIKKLEENLVRVAERYRFSFFNFGSYKFRIDVEKLIWGLRPTIDQLRQRQFGPDRLEYCLKGYLRYYREFVVKYKDLEEL